MNRDWSKDITTRTEEEVQRNPLSTEDTLSSLIEQCGSEFYSVVRAMENDWRAFSNEDVSNTIAVGKASTPEEAVRNLLNQLKK